MRARALPGLIGAAAAALALLVPPAGPANAQEIVAFDRQAPMLLRTLARAADAAGEKEAEIHVTVVHRGDAEGAKKAAGAFQAAGENGVEGHPVAVDVAEFTAVSELLSTIRSRGSTALYVHPSAARAANSLKQVSQAEKIASLGSNRELVERGCSIGVYSRAGTPKIAVNKRAMKVEGVQLSETYLSVVDVVK